MLSTASMLSCMPHDVWTGIARGLPLRDVGQVAACCKAVAEECIDSELWFNVFMNTCWPPSRPLLAFAEGASADPTRVDWRARLLTRAQTAAAIVVDVGRGYSKYGVVHGLHGCLGNGQAQLPWLVQHCSSPTHPPDCDSRNLLSFIHFQLDKELLRAASDPSDPLHRVAINNAMSHCEAGRAVLKGLVAKPELNGRGAILGKFDEERGRWSATLVPLPPFRARSLWTMQGSHSLDDAGNAPMLFKPENLVPVRGARDLPLVIGEPFAVTASRGETTEIESSSWARQHLIQCASRAGPVTLVPQAQMALWCFAVNHGIVVNIGQGQTIAIPVIDGQIVASAASCSNVASGNLTRFMTQLLSRRFEWFDDRHMTFCRDLKEAHCYVAPPSLCRGGKGLQDRLQAGEDVGVRPVLVEGPDIRHGQADDFELGVECVLVPELLFDSELSHDISLPDLVLQCAAGALAGGLCDADSVRRLLRQVVLVGGAADIPGIRPRTEHEIRARIYNKCAAPQLLEAVTNPEDVFVLNPPRVANGPLTSPRFVPFVGGCVRAVSSERLLPLSPSELEMTPDEDLELRHEQGRLPGSRMWRDRHTMNLDGPAVFRTGGGQGEDDRIWQALRLVLARARRQQGIEEDTDENTDHDEDSNDAHDTQSAGAHAGDDASASEAPDCEEYDEDGECVPAETHENCRSLPDGVLPRPQRPRSPVLAEDVAAIPEPPILMTEDLRLRLGSMTLQALKTNARRVGISEQKVQDADFETDPKEAVVQMISARLAEMRSDLQGMNLEDLKTKARELGVSEQALQDVDDEECPREAVIRIILGKQVAH